MAKKNISTKFTKARIYKDGNTHIIAEVNKDENEVTYNLTEILDGYVGVDDLTVSILSTKNIEPMDEVADD